MSAAILTAVVSWEHEKHPYAPKERFSTVQKDIGESELAEVLMDKFGLLLGLLPGEFDDAVDKIFG